MFETSIHKPVDAVFARFTEHIVGRALSYRKSSLLTETTRVSLSRGNPLKTQRPSTFNEIAEQQEEIDLTSPMECNHIDKIQNCLIPKVKTDIKAQVLDVPKKKKSKCCF